MWTDLPHRDPLLVLPLGSLEQHGPHLPLDTDTVIAEALSQRLVEVLTDRGTDTILAPAIHYGASGEHADFPGTVSIGTAALTHLLVELARSATAWTRALVLVSGHGGNRDAIAAAIHTLQMEQRPMITVYASTPGDAHAGHVETSLMLHIAPHRVRTEATEPGVCKPLPHLMPALRAHGIRAVSQNGVLGDPTTATARAGAELMATMLRSALRQLDEQLAVTGSRSRAKATKPRAET